MKTATIADVTQDEFDEAAQLVISGIKASDPRLDTRVGTVLRSLLVNPEARIEATTSKQITYTRTATSLKALKEAEEAGEEIDTDDVNAIMSNFNLKSSSGTYASGLVKVLVEYGDNTYTVSEGTRFTTSDELVFQATQTVTAAVSGEESKLYKGAAGYFLLVPVKATEVGAKGNITQGTSLSMGTPLYSFVSAEAYKTFDGGSDIADLSETIDKIPAGLAIRGFVNKSACEGMLRDEFDSGDHPILACSTVGYGNSAQRRDRHNPFGVGVGGRIDLYVRNFGDIYTVTKVVKGKLTVNKEGAGTYAIAVLPTDFPGSCWVKDVRDVNNDGATGDDGRGVNGSLEFSCSRVSYTVGNTWHDIKTSVEDPSEAFNTVWQGLAVEAKEVTELDGEMPEEREFSVTVYCLPQATELQEYVDRDDVRSVSTDVVVRCPVICNVTVSASVIYDVDDPMDVEDAKVKIRRYINSLGFVGVLTRSEIVHVLKSCGAVSVDLGAKDMLYGTLHDAFGVEHRLSGDSLSIAGLADDTAMLTPDTTIFAAEAENIQIKMTPNK